MGRKGGKGSSKGAKVQKFSLNKFSAKGGTAVNSIGSTGSTKRKNKSGNIYQQRKSDTGNEFEQSVRNLQERVTGPKKTNSKRTPAVIVKPATFQLPVADALPSAALEQAKQPNLVDSLLHGEKSKLKAPRPKPNSNSSSFNRFHLLENDEILEDGMHSILKMEVRPATFTLPQQQTMSDDWDDL